MAQNAHGGSRPGVQPVALAAAGILLLVGVLGFVPGITTDYAAMRFAGRHSEAMLLGLFQVSVLLNILHLSSGLVGLALARRIAGARAFLAVGGALYLGLWLYGFFIHRGSVANFIPVNDADTWLHLAIGFGMLACGLLISGQVGTGGRLDTPIDRP
ncbi:DUF4383 domain-containing protein [Micromonospora sp. WMMA1363]|uniref:DUF4383 domain-containing protein n=1 Tax=Micromonospora sp. WMMA1363 TaxID=3053985 RepID=UPI00259C7E1D|nr:DUF4383 domain-containing protein [Micromonospora sp. WMMA1363]MDM4720316.1 DUF4383 domain-containing protein [Micromonospora sp. WMMA1363]